MNIKRLVSETLRLVAFTLVVIVGVSAIVASGGGSSPPSPPTLLSESGSQTAQVGATATFSVTASNAESYQWQTSTTGTWVHIAGARSASYTTPPVNLAMDGTQYRVVISGAGTTVTSATFVLTVTESVTAPTISVQPTDQSVVVGQSASLSVVADGRLLSYLWQVSVDNGANWSALGGATTADLSLPNLALADDGKRYRVIVSNSAGQVTSASALLSVSSSAIAAAIAVQPANQSVNIGGTLSLSVTAVGTSLSYQWQRSPNGTDWATIAGATRSSLSVPGVTEADDGARFRVVVSNTLATVTSNAATLSVVPAGVVVAPSIVSQPTDQTVGEGQNATLSVTAGGTAPTYQWQASSNSGTSWTDVSGAVAPTLVLASVSLADSGKRYKVIVTNSAGSVESQSATVTVTPALTPPTITTQPQGQTTRIVGQNVTLTVVASGTVSTYAWESSPNGNDPWTAVPGGNAATLVVSGLAITDHGKRYRVKVSNDANAANPVISVSAIVNVKWGEVTTSNDLSRLELTYDGSGGDSPGGGDGAGADGGGGLGKTLNALLTVTRLADGALVGEALTDGSTGLVRIKAGPGAGPFLVTLQGNATATYYDEGKNALLPFGPGQVLHALVDRIDENVGVSAFTEAAYRYALNNFVGNPVNIRAGTSPLLSVGNVVGLTQAQVQAANDAVLAEINRLLPAATKLTSVKSLPTPIDAASPSSALPVSRYGLAAVVTGGFVRNANNYLPSATLPALQATEQLARDLTDGKLNGFALDGAPASLGALTYDTVKLPTALDAANYSVSGQFGSTTTFALGSGSTDFTIGFTHPGGDQGFGCVQTIDNAILRKDGRVSLLRMSPDIGNQCVSATNSTIIQNFATDTRFIEGGFRAVFIVKNTGDVLSWGDAICGILGNASATGRATTPSAVGAGVLSDVTSLKTGNYFALARDKTGSVYTWGSDTNGTLGLGAAPTYDNASCDVSSGAPGGPGANTAPRQVPGLSDIVSVGADQLTAFAVDRAGQLFQWGSALTGAFADLTTPTLVSPGLPKVTAVVGAGQMAFALAEDGTVYGFGQNTNGNFGDGRLTPVPTPTQVPELANVVQLAGAPLGEAAALMRDGTIKIWNGSNSTTPTTPATVRLCTVPNSTSTTCIAETTGPVPKIRHISSAGQRLTFVAENGIVYSKITGGSDFYTVAPF